MDKDTQLFRSEAEVLTALLTSTISAGLSLDSIVSDSSILILFTISPYNLLSINAEPVAWLPEPGGAEKVTVGGVV